MAAGGRRPTSSRRARRGRGLRELWLFLGGALIAFVVVAAATLLISDRIARQQALDDAALTTERIAQLVVGPLVTEALAGAPGREEELDGAVRNRLADDAITSLIVWTADGEVLYSSRDELVGERFPPSAELVRALSGDVVSTVDEDPETSYAGRSTGPSVEVYAAITDADPPLVLEVYYSYDTIREEAAEVRAQIIPVALGALGALQIVQVPIAVRMARRIRQHEAERTELVERSLVASDLERREIAAGLHEGPVQDLAGVGYSLTALRGSVPAEQRAALDRVVGSVHAAVESLRRVMVDVYPPDLSGTGLPMAIEALAEPLRAAGVKLVPVLDLAPLPALDHRSTAVLYRTAKEALQNVARHARATTVWIELAGERLHGRDAVRLEIADDGVGFPADHLDRQAEGHLGLRLIHDWISDLEGTVELSRRAEGGAVVTAVVPLRSAG